MQIPFDSWPVKFAIVGALLTIKLFVHLCSPADAEGKRSESSRSVTETLDSAAIALGLVLFIIQPFVLQAFYIPSGSMEDTLRIKDRLLVSKLIFRLREPNFQDIVVFRAPEAVGTESAGQDFIKRCIGTPGAVIEVKNRQLFRNGQPINEPYPKWSAISAPIYSYDMKIVDGKIYSREYQGAGYAAEWKQAPGIYEPDQKHIEQAKPEAVPPKSLLMLGDHRNNSNDSHAWGFVPRENVVGKAIFVFWPPLRIGMVDKKSQTGPDIPNTAPVAVR